jgi:hypothetical protein
VVLETILLVLTQGHGMIATSYSSCPTSNDLLFELMARHSRSQQNDIIIAQSADVRKVENAPAVNKGRACSDQGTRID